MLLWQVWKGFYIDFMKEILWFFIKAEQVEIQVPHDLRPVIRRNSIKQRVILVKSKTGKVFNVFFDFPNVLKTGMGK